MSFVLSIVVCYIGVYVIARPIHMLSLVRNILTAQIKLQGAEIEKDLKK